MIQNITIIGGGSTGFAATAWLTAKGFKVTLCDNESFLPILDEIEKNNGILLRGKAGRRGLFKPEKVTCDPAEAIPGAELIIICVPAKRHEEIAEFIAPYVTAGMDILISPGNLGSFVFRDVFERRRVSGVRLSELEGNICPCRITGPAEATVGLPIRKKRIACLQGGLTGKVIARLDGVFEFEANRNVFECALLSDNFVLHIGTCLLSAARIEQLGKEFIMFQHALTPASIDLAAAVQIERKALLARLGLKERDSASEFFEELIDHKNHPEYSVFRTLDGPDSIQHRYIDEDSRACAALALSLAERFGIKMPVLGAIVTIAGTLNGLDYLEIGRTLRNLGFADDLSGDEIIAEISKGDA